MSRYYSSILNVLSPSFNNTYSLAFDGVDDYLDCGDVTTLSNATTFTYSGWYKQTTLDVISYMFGSYIDVSNRLIAYTWSSGLMYFQIEKTASNFYAGFDYSTVVTASQWFHLAVVYDGSGATNADKVKIYIDGVLMTLSFIGAFPSSTPLGTNITTIGKVDDAAIVPAVHPTVLIKSRRVIPFFLFLTIIVLPLMCDCY